MFHTVQPGDVPVAIAAQYGISVDALMAANEITDPTTLQIGDQLLIPAPATSATQPPSSPSTPRASPAPTDAPTFHTVNQGEVLASIAVEYDTTAEAIMIANDITDPRTLQIGQKLIIPAPQPGATPAPELTLPRITSPAPPEQDLLTLEQAVVEAVNRQRQAQGLPALASDDPLAVVARTHAQDMVARDYFSHVTPEGITLSDRLREHGLEVNWAGENIQRNTQPATETVQNTVNWFMDSEPHRNNILHVHFSHIGAGVAEGPPGWYTFVLVFAGGENE